MISKTDRLRRPILAMLVFVLAGSLAYAAEQVVVLNRESYFSVYGLYGPHERGPGQEKSSKRTRRRRKGKQYILKAPPEDWTKPDYTDSDWPRRRSPYLTDLKSAYLRTWFLVKDVSGPINLSLTYRGGVKVYLNGHEIGSSHIKDGKAELYPLDAYRLLPEEKHPKARWPWPLSLAQKYERMRASKKYQGWRECSGRVPMQKTAWQRLLGQRNRKLGPLKLPAEHLVKGKNLLAIEIHRPNLHPKGRGHSGGKYFSHFGLLALEVKADPLKVESAIKRPGGTRVWAEDIHMRIFNVDYLPAGTSPGQLQLVGGKGGTYNSQLVLGTENELSDFKVTVSPLKQIGATKTTDGSRTIDPCSVEVRYAMQHPLSAIGRALGGFREGMVAERGFPFFLSRYCPSELRHLATNYAARKKYPKIKALFSSLKYFDQLSAIVPRRVPAHSTQPIWISVSVPRDTSAGHYEGNIQVEASGGFSQSVPLKIEVVDWQVPSPRDFTTLVWADQNPYSVAAQYKVKAWSEEHLKLVERSLIQLGRIGDDILTIPVVNKTEFSTNNTENPIKWFRRKDGSLAFDYTNLDKYLDLAIKHWGTPKLIVFIVVPGGAKRPLLVSVRDEASGKVEELRLNPSDANRHVWGQFATSLYNHMHSRGLHRNMYWGLNKDITTNPSLQPLLAEFAPEVMWAVTAHGRLPDQYNKLVARIYGYPGAPDIMKRGKPLHGWKSRQLLFTNSRVCSGVLVFEGFYSPFAHRPWAELALSHGYRGVGRFGADHWGRWHKHYGPSHAYTPGFGTMNILWPGVDGPDGSARLEIFREGLQEAEAKVFLEKAVDQGLVNEEWTQKINKLLMDRLYAVSKMSADNYHTRQSYYDNHQQWRQRSQALYRMAALVARQLPANAISENKQEQKVAQAETKPAFEILLHREAFTVQDGQSTPLSLGFINRTEESVQWTAHAEPSWASVMKASGCLDPGKVQLFQCQFKPEWPTGTETHATITIKDHKARLLCQRMIPFKMLVALPTGKKIPVLTLPEKIKVVKKTSEKSKHKSSDLRWAKDKKGKSLNTLLMEPNEEEVTFHIENSGIKAFSARISWSRNYVKNRNSRYFWKTNGVLCEVYVDGELVKKSPVYKGVGVSPQILVVEGLEKAKTIKLVCVYGEGNYENLRFISLTEPTFYVGK